MGNLVKLLSAGKMVKLTIDSTQAEIIKNLGFGASLVMLILTSILSIVIIICGFSYIYSVFQILKILIIVPFGAIALSTISGNRMVSHTATTYVRYFCQLCLKQ